jgi:hypothetical protein
MAPSAGLCNSLTGSTMCIQRGMASLPGCLTWSSLCANRYRQADQGQHPVQAVQRGAAVPAVHRTHKVRAVPPR